MLYSLDAGFRDAVLAPQMCNARLAFLLRRDAIVALLPGASGQRHLRESGLQGPTLMGACILRLTRRGGFALAFDELVLRGLNLRSLAFGSPNADLTH